MQAVIGVNKYKPESEAEIAVLKVDNSAVRKRQIEKLQQLRAERDEKVLAQKLENPVGAVFVYSDLSMITLSFTLGKLVQQLKLVGAATVLEPDNSGRVLLPGSHRNAAGIEKRAVLLGMGSKLELWSEQAHLAQIRHTIIEDDISDAMLDLRI